MRGEWAQSGICSANFVPMIHASRCQGICLYTAFNKTHPPFFASYSNGLSLPLVALPHELTIQLIKSSLCCSGGKRWKQRRVNLYAARSAREPRTSDHGLVLLVFLGILACVLDDIVSPQVH